MYYFDQAATSLKKPRVVADAMYEAICSETIGNPKTSLEAGRILYRTREVIKQLFKATNYHVVLTKNATEALNIALKGLFHEGDHLITTVIEHNAALRPLYELEEKGVELSFVGCDKQTGVLLYEQFEPLLTKQTKAVVVSHASNVTGNVTDLKWLSDFCQKHQLQLIVDGAQSAGMIAAPLDDLGIDVFCFTGHKSLYGPQGTGGMCIKKGIEMRPLMTGGSGFATFSKIQPSSLPEALEAGTANVHSIAGLCAAVEWVLDADLFIKVSQLTKYFFEAVNQIGGVQIYGDHSRLNSGIVALNIKNYDSSEVSDTLFENYQILTRSGAHCAPLMHQHLGTESQGMVRFSFSMFNTLEEVKYAVNAIKELVSS